MKFKYVPLLLIPLLVLSGCNPGGGLAYGEIVNQVVETIDDPEDIVQYLGSSNVELNEVQYTGYTYFQVQTSDEYNHLEGSEDGPITGTTTVYQTPYMLEDTTYLALRIIQYDEDSETYSMVEDLSTIDPDTDYYLGAEFDNDRYLGFTFLTGAYQTDGALTASREATNILAFKINVLEDNKLTIQVNEDKSTVRANLGDYLALSIDGITYRPTYSSDEFVWEWQEDYYTLIYNHTNDEGEEIEIFVYGSYTTTGARYVYAMASRYANSSIMLRVPLHLDYTNFYVTSSDGTLSSTSQYYTIKYALVSANTGSDYDLSIGRTSDGHIIFYAASTNKAANFYGFIDESTAIYMSIKADIALEYDENGYLIREAFVPLQYQAEGKSAYGDYHYSYYAEED